MEFSNCLKETKPDAAPNDIKNDLVSIYDWYDAEELENDENEEDTNGPLYFETDHTALRGNSDYHALMRSLTILEVQRIKTIKDIERLEKMLLEVKYNAKAYLNKITNGDTSDFPTSIIVEKVPVVDWEKYRLKNHSADTPCEQKYIPVSQFATTAVQNSLSGDDTNPMIVRGRVYDKTKPQTFNQLWTAEEQLRLEELLLEYPAESNENNRWRKIAQALGNRTTKQVCSRVQKYFKKLNKAGLPIPGHQLKTNNMPSTKKNRRRLRKSNLKQSTFFPSDHLDVNRDLAKCDEDETVPAVPNLTAELKVDIIKKVIEYKQKDAQLSPFKHSGIKCSICGESPICGTRWSCLVCRTTSLCSDCVIHQLNTDLQMHPPTHPLEPITNPSVAHWDPDYTPQSFNSDNYLDPNFVTPNII